MHAVSTAVLLASLGAGTLAASFHGLFFTSSDPDCLLVGSPTVPTDGAKGQFSGAVGAVKSQLQSCTLFVREESDGAIKDDTVLVISAGDRQCHALPHGNLHWNTVCEDDEEDDEDED